VRAPGRGCDRPVAGAGGVFLLLVGRLRRRRVSVPVTRRSCQRLDGFPAARSDGRAAGPAEFRYGERCSAWPCGCARCRDRPRTWGRACARPRCCGRPRSGPARQFRSGGCGLPVGFAHRPAEKARLALIIAQGPRPADPPPRTGPRPGVDAVIVWLCRAKSRADPRAPRVSSCDARRCLRDYFVYIGLLGGGASGPHSL
jgi:hypothetical protein